MKKRILNNSEMALFCDQMGMIIEAGISPGDGISIMLEDTEDKDGREILKIIGDSCEKGDSFFKAVSLSEVFPKYALNMIEIGEKSGKLEEVMKSLAFHYNREKNISESIKNAVTYPFLIIMMMLAVILVLIIKVLPIFNDVFIQLGSELTGLAGKMMNIGNVIGKYAIVIVCVSAALFILCFVFTKIETGRKLLNKIMNGIAGNGKINEAVAAGRFAAAMSLTISAGLDMEDSLDMVSDLVDDSKMKSKILKCKEIMNSGQSFSNALFKAGIFTNVYARMMLIGSKTGSTERALEDIAEGYEEQVNERINKMISVLEPTLVIILSLVVCLILMSVMLPLMAIMTTMM